jgi:hypothetical protein
METAKLIFHNRCAAGSSLSPRTDLGLPHDAAEFFTSLAELLLEIEMDSLSIATVQALVIMSTTEAAFTKRHERMALQRYALSNVADMIAAF